MKIKKPNKNKLYVMLHLLSVVLLFSGCLMYVVSNQTMLLNEIKNLNFEPIFLLLIIAFLAVRIFLNLSYIENKNFFKAERFRWVFILCYIIAFTLIIKESFLTSLSPILYLFFILLSGIIEFFTPSVNANNSEDF